MIEQHCPTDVIDWEGLFWRRYHAEGTAVMKQAKSKIHIFY